MAYVSTLELLECVQKQIAGAIRDANSVEIMLGRWRIIQFRLGKLEAQLRDLSRCSPGFLESYTLCREVLEAALGTIHDSALMAGQCHSLLHAQGKLRTQSHLDSLAARLSEHIHDVDVVIRNSLLRESLDILTRKRSTISNREMLRFVVRDLLTRLQIAGTDPESKHRALNSMVDLMNRDDKNTLAVAGLGGVPVLVQLLDAGISQPVTVRELAASAVCSLVRAGCCEQELVSEGVLSPLVRLLESGTGTARERAVSALHALTSNADNARTVAVRGGVPPLVELCRSGTPAAQAAAAGVLRNLAVISELRAGIAEEEVGAVAALLGVIKSGTDAARESASDALHSLSLACGATRGILRLGAVEAVLRFLDTGPPPKAREFAMGILRNISKSGGVAGGAAYNGLLKVVSEGGGGGEDGEGESGKVVKRKRLTLSNVMMAWKQIHWRNNAASTSRIDSKIKNFFFRR